MAYKNKLSPTDRLTYVQKGKIKRDQGSWFRNFFLSLLILGIFILIIVPSIENYKKRKKINLEIEAVKKDILYYENSKEELKEIVDYLKSEQGLEEKARLNHGLQKPGEQVVVIKKRNLITEDFEEEEGEELSNIRKWWNYFFLN